MTEPTEATEQQLHELMTPAEVADFFRVDAKTVSRWARSGKISSFRTLGGHRRFRRNEVVSLVVPEQPEAT